MMKLLNVWLVVCWVVSAQSFAQATDFYVYYLGGQSNMDGLWVCQSIACRPGWVAK